MTSKNAETLFSETKQRKVRAKNIEVEAFLEKYKKVKYFLFIKNRHLNIYKLYNIKHKHVKIYNFLKIYTINIYKLFFQNLNIYVTLFFIYKHLL